LTNSQRYLLVFHVNPDTNHSTNPTNPNGNRFTSGNRNSTTK